MHDIENYTEWKAESFDSYQEIIKIINTAILPLDNYNRALYRGHSTSSWELDTTLERYLKQKISLLEYHRLMIRVKPTIESYTQRKWKIDSQPNYNDDGLCLSINGYPFMAYLRHHGFPSPLLDWSISPYIGLFFAFCDVNPNTTENVAIYILHKSYGDNYQKGLRVLRFGPYISTHARHFSQQSRYTVCASYFDDGWKYMSHDAYFKSSQSVDYVNKVVMPARLRNEILNTLNMMNINKYTLFANEDGLIYMLAFNEIYGEHLHQNIWNEDSQLQ